MAIPSFLRGGKPADEQAILLAVREAVAESGMTDKIVDSLHAPHVEAIDDSLRARLKLDKLVADDFPFDESQVEMIEGVVNHLIFNGGQGACATGAAGTGKTTSTKKIVDRLMESASFLKAVDMDTYFKKGDPSPEEDIDEDGKPIERSKWVPSICMVGFTGRSTQMIKKNFPRSWHTNIMTIHRCLAFMPVWEEVYDIESGNMKNRMHFEPTFNGMNLLPWDIIIIDEAGMVGLDLWEQLRVALKPTCKIIMIGDINQLPPVHGRSVFGFAMGTWPSWELTHVHRQQDSQDKIVDNAWRILKGQMPESGGNFQMVKFDDLATKASQQVRRFLPQITEKGIYDPIRDSCITATNGLDGQRGFALGQIPLNREFAIIFNKDNPRYMIDAGRERQKFAVGDKVMATRNDYEAGITNGMTGIIVEITENGAYSGDRRRFGTMEDVNRWAAEDAEELVDPEDVSVEDMMESYAAQEQGKADAKEAKDRGPSSHHVTVRFGSDHAAFDITFSTLAEVASLMTAYVVTCHKMQGGECPVVVIILHTAHKSMHFREWLYTAVTRGSERVILLYTDQALRNVLTKQKIKGSTLAQKVEAFMALSREGIAGAAVKVNLAWGAMSNLPAAAESTELSDVPFGEDTDIAEPNPEFEPEFEPQSRRYESVLPDWLLGILLAALTRQSKPFEDVANPMDAVWEEVDEGQLAAYHATRLMFQPPETRLLTYQPIIEGFPALESYVDEVLSEAASAPEPKAEALEPKPINPRIARALSQIAGAKVQTIPSTPINPVVIPSVIREKKTLAFLMNKQKGN